MSMEKGLEGSLEQAERAFGNIAYSDYITGQMNSKLRGSAQRCVCYFAIEPWILVV